MCLTGLYLKTQKSEIYRQVDTHVVCVDTVRILLKDRSTHMKYVSTRIEELSKIGWHTCSMCWHSQHKYFQVGRLTWKMCRHSFQCSNLPGWCRKVKTSTYIMNASTQSSNCVDTFIRKVDTSFKRSQTVSTYWKAASTYSRRLLKKNKRCVNILSNWVDSFMKYNVMLRICYVILLWRTFYYHSSKA